MTRLQSLLAALAGVFCAAAFFFPFAKMTDAADATALTATTPALALAAVGIIFSCAHFRFALSLWLDGAFILLGGAVLFYLLSFISGAHAGFWLLFAAFWLYSWLFVDRLATVASNKDETAMSLVKLFIPLLFGAVLIIVWEVGVHAGNVSPVLLPPLSVIGARIISSWSILLADFQQTVLKAVLFGYVVGCGAGFIVAVVAERSRFLQNGLLPLSNFISALPIIGVAPIMVMWFGFDWQSKAAVVVIMTFFPMLTNTVVGLNAAGRMERDLLNTTAAGYWQTLFKLQLPAAMPFIFNALKINSTLALIGAIVAEFFGTPIVGMGFRISTEVGRMNLDMVWAEIAMAALTGVVLYGALTLLERRILFWHPSIRRG